MPQEFQVLRCYKCFTFQVHQVKKSTKYNCKLCGEKQSIKKVFGCGSAADCRRHVQKCNMKQGERKTTPEKISTDRQFLDFESGQSKTMVVSEGSTFRGINNIGYVPQTDDSSDEKKEKIGWFQSDSNCGEDKSAMAYFTGFPKALRHQHAGQCKVQKPYGRQVFKESDPNWRRKALLALDDVHSSTVKFNNCKPVRTEADNPDHKSFDFVENLGNDNIHARSWRETAVCNEVRENEWATLFNVNHRTPASTSHSNADLSNSEHAVSKTELPVFATDDDIDDIINDF